MKKFDSQFGAGCRRFVCERSSGNVAEEKPGRNQLRLSTMKKIRLVETVANSTAM